MSIESIATGSPLTKETFDDFISRLKYHCQGEGVADHYTADAIFCVQRKVRAYTEYNPEWYDSYAITSEDNQTVWDDVDSWLADLSELEEVELKEAYDVEDLTTLSEDDVLENLQAYSSYYVYSCFDKWETLNVHFTKEAAEAFIRRKKHDYPLGLRVYVDAQTYCWEFNTIKQALMDGRLQYVEGHKV